MADPQNPVEQQVPMPQQPADQQVTSKTPATRPQKNPKRVAAGKAIAERTRIAREEQKKALIQAQSIIAQAKPPADAQAKPPAAPASEDPVAVTLSTETTKNVLTTTQWLAIISITVSLAGLYYKREELKNVLSKKASPPPRAPPPSPVLTRAPPGIREMD